MKQTLLNLTAVTFVALGMIAVGWVGGELLTGTQGRPLYFTTPAPCHADSYGFEECAR